MLQSREARVHPGVKRHSPGEESHLGFDRDRKGRANGGHREVGSSPLGTGGTGDVDTEHGSREEAAGLVTNQQGEGAVGGGKGPRYGYWCELLGGTEVSGIPRGKELR